MKDMVMRKKLVIGIGVVLIGLAAVWRFGVAPRLTQRVPPGWSWSSNFIGTTSYADPQTGELPEKATVATYERRMYLASEAGRPRAVTVEDSYITFDPKTRQKLWEYNYRAEVDPQTGAHVRPEYQGEVYVFPRNVEKTTYKFRNNYIKGVPLSFQREEEVEGVNTYLFAYKGRGEYTESYAGTKDFPGYKAEPGQELRCANDQFTVKVWVEPVTGEILKFDERCPSGTTCTKSRRAKRSTRLTVGPA